MNFVHDSTDRRVEKPVNHAKQGKRNCNIRTSINIPSK